MAYELTHNGTTVLQTQRITDALVKIHKLRYAGAELDDMVLSTRFFSQTSPIATDAATFETMWPSLHVLYITPIEGVIEEEVRLLSVIDERIRRVRDRFECDIDIVYDMFEYKVPGQIPFVYRVYLRHPVYGDIASIINELGLSIHRYHVENMIDHVYLTLEEIEFMAKVYEVFKSEEELVR